MSLQIEFERYTLSNGLKVLLHEDHHVPVVAINLWYNVGSKNEKPGKTGFAHLFEHMMFQGSKHVPGEKHFQLVQGAGGTVNGSTFFDRTNYFETLPSNYLEMGLWLEADRMGYLLPAMTQDKLDNQRDVVKNERRQVVDNQPYGLWLEKLLELAYPPDFPYHWPVIGYMHDLERATLDDISEFFSAFYVPNNASLVIAGDIEPQRTLSLIEKYFGDIPKGKKPVFEKPDLPGFNMGEKAEIVKDHVQLPRIYRAYHLPPLGDMETYAADILSDILSYGKSARLYRSLVYEQQIAQEALAFLVPMVDTSLFIVVATPKPDTSPEKLESSLQAEIIRIIEEGVSETELQRVKNQIEVRKIREIQSVSHRADNLNMFTTYFDNPGLINTEIDIYEKITSQQVIDVAGKYLNNDNSVKVTFLPENGEKP